MVTQGGRKNVKQLRQVGAQSLRRGSNRALKKRTKPRHSKIIPRHENTNPGIKKKQTRHGLWQPFSGLQRPKTAKKGHEYYYHMVYHQ